MFSKREMLRNCIKIVKSYVDMMFKSITDFFKFKQGVSAERMETFNVQEVSSSVKSQEIGSLECGEGVHLSIDGSFAHSSKRENLARRMDGSCLQIAIKMSQVVSFRSRRIE